MNTPEHKGGPARLKRGSLLAAGWCVLAGAWAQPVPQDMDAAKTAIEARYRDAVQACQSRFAVNACLQDAKAERQRALQPLQEQELAASLAQREQRASESRQRLQQKAQEQARLEAQQRSAALLAPPLRPVPAEVPTPTEPPSQAAQPLPDPQKQQADDEAAAAQRARDQRQRLQAAQEHRKQALKRLQERTAHKPLAAPLPPASGSSVPR